MPRALAWCQASAGQARAHQADGLVEPFARGSGPYGWSYGLPNAYNAAVVRT